MSIRVEFEADIPADATKEQVEEWIKYELGATGRIETANPLSDHGLTAKWFTVRVTHRG